jgi:hypothetical protein
MIVIFTEAEKNKKARYQRGSVELRSGENLQVDALGIIVTNFSKTTKHVVASNIKLNRSMVIKIDDDGNDSNDGHNGMLN